MYIARFSYDVLPVNREQAIEFIQREIEAAHRKKLKARLLVPLTRGQGGSALQFEVELPSLDQFEQFRERGIGSGDRPTQYLRTRETPWASAVLGHCYGSSSWYAALADFAVMRKGAVMAVSSVKLTSMAIGEEVDPEALGGWEILTGVSGLVDMAVDTDEEALDAVKRFLHEQARRPLAEVKRGGMWGLGEWPASYPTEADALVPITQRWQDIMVVVAGGTGKHSCWLPTFGVTRSVTRPILTD